MAIKSLKEFCESMGMPYDTAKKNAQRGNIIKGTDGKIDTENPINRLFFDKQISLKGTKITKTSSETKGKKVFENQTSLSFNQKQYVELDLRTKIATAESKERENELKRIQLEKQAGNLLPVDLCEKIITINIQAVFKSFEGEMENMASIYNEEFGGNRTTLVNIVKKQREVFARAIKKAGEDADYELKNAVDEFQDTRDRGQRKP
jgi:hypothetical protein